MQPRYPMLRQSGLTRGEYPLFRGSTESPWCCQQLRPLVPGPRGLAGGRGRPKARNFCPEQAWQPLSPPRFSVPYTQHQCDTEAKKPLYLNGAPGVLIPGSRAEPVIGPATSGRTRWPAPRNDAAAYGRP
jgi:hypothetical protein